MSEDAIQVGAGAVIMKDNKVLLAKRKGSHASGSYGTVGGHVDYGETPIEAVKREAMEELGIEIGAIEFASCTNMIKYEKHYIDISFVARSFSGKPKIMEPHKIESFAWYDLDDLPEPLFEPVRIVLDAIKTNKSYYEVDNTNSRK